MAQALANISFAHVFSSIPGIFHNFHFHDALDIIVVAFFVYVILLFIKQSRSYFIFNTLLLLFIIIYLSRTFNLALTRKLFEPLITFFAVIFVIVFQREIRRFFKWFIISRERFGRHLTNLSAEVSSAIVEAVGIMAKKRTGALLILSGEYPLDDIVEGGFPLNGEVSVPLLLSIFDNTTPGHDGAVLIENKKIKTFGLHLPLAEDFRGFKNMGTRHRAALGLAERSDALVIVVSEERGIVSVAENGALRTVTDAPSLQGIVRNFMKENVQENQSFWYYILVNNFFIKILSVLISFALWVLLVFQANVVTESLIIPLEFSHIPSNLIVSKVIPADVNLSISGNSSDLHNLNQNSVRIVIDLTNAAAGTKQVIITGDNISMPSYITLNNITPNKVLIGLQKAGP
ncbi:MAG TPA: diadenylate cyclase [Candidatus Paceibacterota bacterium]|nr:diadenylate cyclase [Candidatus Paceibacterota bacterium]